MRKSIIAVIVSVSSFSGAVFADYSSDYGAQVGAIGSQVNKGIMHDNGLNNGAFDTQASRGTMHDGMQAIQDKAAQEIGAGLTQMSKGIVQSDKTAEEAQAEDNAAKLSALQGAVDSHYDVGKVIGDKSANVNLYSGTSTRPGYGSINVAVSSLRPNTPINVSVNGVVHTTTAAELTKVDPNTQIAVAHVAAFQRNPGKGSSNGKSSSHSIGGSGNGANNAANSNSAHGLGGGAHVGGGSSMNGGFHGSW